MDNNKINNGLNLINIKSRVVQNIEMETLDNISKFVNKNNKESFVVAYLVNEIMIGKFIDNKFVFHENKHIDDVKFLKRLRIFNPEEELLLWRDHNLLKGRYRMDMIAGAINTLAQNDSAQDCSCVEAYQVLFGTKVLDNKDDNRKDVNDLKDVAENFTTIYEERGTKITLPGTWKVNNRKDRVALQTRHYIDYFDGIQATYADARFVNFVQLPIINRGGDI
jgi:CRISPR-associated protein (TIGR03984 family)